MVIFTGEEEAAGPEEWGRGYCCPCGLDWGHIREEKEDLTKVSIEERWCTVIPIFRDCSWLIKAFIWPNVIGQRAHDDKWQFGFWMKLWYCCEAIYFLDHCFAWRKQQKRKRQREGAARADWGGRYRCPRSYDWGNMWEKRKKKKNRLKRTPTKVNIEESGCMWVDVWVDDYVYSCQIVSHFKEIEPVTKDHLYWEAIFYGQWVGLSRQFEL